MYKILITGFEPFDNWDVNTSKLCIEELSQNKRYDCEIKTKIYPVDFKITQRTICADIQTEVDYAIHLGQIDTSNKIHLEKIGLNVGENECKNKAEVIELIEGGPLALQSEVPLERWKKKVHSLKIPVGISFHAGTYLCNALLYWSLYYCRKYEVKTKSTFIHLPIIPSAINTQKESSLGLELEKSVEAVQCIIEDICNVSSTEL
jgi:pyroglutamyl-peptidase